MLMTAVPPPLTASEQAIYAELCRTAERGLPCPTYLDLNEIIEAESSSTSSAIVTRLECKGLIIVNRYQRFREVYIVAMDKWTARNPAQRTTAAHVPRGHAVLERAQICRKRKG